MNRELTKVRMKEYRRVLSIRNWQTESTAVLRLSKRGRIAQSNSQDTLHTAEFFSAIFSMGTIAISLLPSSNLNSQAGNSCFHTWVACASLFIAFVQKWAACESVRKCSGFGIAAANDGPLKAALACFFMASCCDCFENGTMISCQNQKTPWRLRLTKPSGISKVIMPYWTGWRTG